MSDIIETQEKKPIAYSYVRFSTAKQELGDSLRRQVGMAERYCEKHGLELHPVSYRDLGVSAFKRKNVENGALAAFIDAVKTGKIEKGSYLVVEQFDRLSRADIDMAVKLLLDLVHSGIKLVTLVDEKVWDKASIKEIGNLVLAIVFMSRANNESAAKAERLSSVWAEKKKQAAATGKILTRECPCWLKVNEDKTAFIVLEDKAESIRKVFEMRIQGGHGSTAIINRANAEGWPVPGKGDSWHTSLVGRMLNNRALLGEYQPYKRRADDDKRIEAGDPVKDYYPAILDEQTFLRAQASRERKGKFPGRRDVNYRNWLQGLLRCTCGHSFVRKSKQSAKQPGYARYYCTARYRRASKCLPVAAQEIENAVIHAVSAIAPQFWNGTARLGELKAVADVQHVKLGASQSKRDRYAEAIGTANSPVSTLLPLLAAAEEEVTVAEKALAATRAEIADLDADSDTVFADIVKAVQNVDSIEARAALREDLSRVLLKCVVDSSAGTLAVYVRGEDVPITVPLRLDAVLPGIQMETMSTKEYEDYLRSEEPQ